MLTEKELKNAKPRDKPYKLAAGGGLHLLIKPSARGCGDSNTAPRVARSCCRFGMYPEISLKVARERRDEARVLMRKGIDPGAQRKAEKVADAETFEAVAREWFEKFAPSWAESHSSKVIRRLELDVFPWLGAKPIRGISPPDLLGCLRRIEARGVIETAHRVQQCCGQIFRYAVATGRADRDPSADLRGALSPVKTKHLASITEPVKIGALLRAMDNYEGTHIARCALRLAPLVFVRPGELRAAEWQEFNLDDAEWRIPAERMKARVKHIVPLSRQAVEVLRELHPLTGAGRYLFPSARTDSRPMSNNTVNAALRRTSVEVAVGIRSTTGQLWR
ncbi:MAG: integrase arm-type DNA-binding domain-containing protein [Gammaproteobacteria bacterium]